MGRNRSELKTKPMADAAAALWVSRERPVAGVATHCDVFLSSAGGSDAARESFPGRLHASLAAGGVIVYGPGESQVIDSSLLLPDEGFRRSKICIPILSKDYPSSERCLRELVQMMEGKRSARQMVVPIFDRVEPSHVRYLTGSFEKARRSDVEGAQGALVEVSMLQGWMVTDGCEEEKLAKIVETVRRYLQSDLQKVPHVAQYNVFLNFRGPDTRHGFTYHLYTGLRSAGVSVFKDDTDLVIGEDFGSQLLSTISRSTMYITIFSPNYASSMWSLRELKKMMDCKAKMGHLVLPVYYKVEPGVVRHQRGKFMDAFRKHELRPGGEYATRDARAALQEVASLRGYHSPERRNDFKCGEMISLIVQEILGALRYKFKLDVPEHLLTLQTIGRYRRKEEAGIERRSCLRRWEPS